MIVLAIPVVVMLLGAVLYFAGAGKWSGLGIEMFKFGLLVALLAVSTGHLAVR